MQDNLSVSRLLCSITISHTHLEHEIVEKIIAWFQRRGVSTLHFSVQYVSYNRIDSQAH